MARPEWRDLGKEKLWPLPCKQADAFCHPAADFLQHGRDFANLAEELIWLSLAEELFTFVLVPSVEPTNNSTERLLRGSTQDRKAGRTNKTAAGAHRRSVIVSVLESLRVTLETFNLASVA